MSWSRSSVNSLVSSPSSRRRASTRALQVSKPPTLRPLPPSPTLPPRRKGSLRDRPQRPPSSPAEPSLLAGGGAAGNATHALFADQSHSFPDNVVALLGYIRAWSCSAEPARSAVGEYSSIRLKDCSGVLPLLQRAA